MLSALNGGCWISPHMRIAWWAWRPGGICTNEEDMPEYRDRFLRPATAPLLPTVLVPWWCYDKRSWSQRFKMMPYIISWLWKPDKTGLAESKSACCQGYLASSSFLQLLGIQSWCFPSSRRVSNGSQWSVSDFINLSFLLSSPFGDLWVHGAYPNKARKWVFCWEIASYC